LSKGKLGEAASNLIGSLLVTAVELAAMRRADVPEERRIDFTAYLDEFHNFMTDAFSSILSEARKYRLSLVLGHQYLDQVAAPVRAAVFGNVGTMVSFAVGHSDAGELAGEFDPYGINTLTGLSRGQVCVRSTSGGETGEPFLGKTFSEVGWSYGGKEKVVARSRRLWGCRREVVEAKISRLAA
jgi:hypothetical protein